jgi:CRISPR-associated exonuclease Cas4
MVDSTDIDDTGGENLIEEFIEREQSPHRDPLVRITGLMVQYYHVCKRELWFSSRGIDIDRGAANIR